MDQKLESFLNLSDDLVQTYGHGALLFTTDLIRFDHVKLHGLGLPRVRTGSGISDNPYIDACIREKKPTAGIIEREVYGGRMRVWVWPIQENGEVIGTYGIMLPQLHPVLQAFEHFARPLSAAFPEGAFMETTDLEKLLARQGSKKFDIPKLVVGMPLIPGGIVEECIKTGKVVTRDLDASVYDLPTRAFSIPLIDPDDESLVGTFTLVQPTVVAGDLQQLAAKLSSNVQEIASVMQEVAASAGEISINEGQLTEKVKEVAIISTQINEVLDFIKNVADQTKMLGLNAAIEAARAGEHGRGFGVVAEEIRKLSDQSKETAERIRKLTREISDKIEIISGVSEGTLKQSEEQAAATEEVTASVMEMAVMAEKLAETARSL